MNQEKLRVGRINYLNIWPIFESIQADSITQNMDFVSGHPSLLNLGLAKGEIDLSPSSSFEYLQRAEQYMLIPDQSISSTSEVQSVLFCLPFSFDCLEKYVRDGGRIRLTKASAASVALLKVLWTFFWKLPNPSWTFAEPGESIDSKEPFLEIGDFALNIYLNPPSGLYVIDLANQWKKFTGLPFVFALWIVNIQAWKNKRNAIEKLSISLNQAREELPNNVDSLARLYPDKKITTQMIKNYWASLDFSLKAEHLSGLSLFGNYLSRLKLIPGMPVLDFIPQGGKYVRTC